MKYNPAIHHRRSIRLKGYDYSKQGMYFITICCHQRKCWFGKIENETMMLNEYGLIADNEWVDLLQRFPNIDLGEFVIMPNHMHGIIIIKSSDNSSSGSGAIASSSGSGAIASSSGSGAIASSSGSGASPDPTSVGDMIGAYKSLVANKCLDIFEIKNTNQTMGKLWQRNFYEHIIRDEQSFTRISNYIKNNPKNRKNDKFNI
jgi:putative transposase